MIAAVIRRLINGAMRMDQGEKCLKKRLQDTSRTLFHRKTEAFPLLHVGASVGERAARKEKGSNFNSPNGTTAGFRRNAVRP